MTTVPHWTVTCLMISVSAALGCGAGVPAPAPDPPPAVREPTVHKTRALPRATLPDGFVVKLELAISPEEVTQGLMFRTSLAANRGMLFLFEEERLPSFWMKNTLIPLDIVYLDAQGVVIDVTHNAQPCKIEPCPQYLSKKPALAALELTAGSARAHDLVEGARITFKRVPDYPVEVLEASDFELDGVFGGEDGVEDSEDGSLADLAAVDEPFP